MGWDERLFDLLDDLEGQAEALYAAERDAELADRSRAEYAAVTLAGRLMASVGRDVLLDVDGTGPVRGELRRVGTGWCLVSGDAGDWLVPLAAITAVLALSVNRSNIGIPSESVHAGAAGVLLVDRLPGYAEDLRDLLPGPAVLPGVVEEVAHHSLQ